MNRTRYGSADAIGQTELSGGPRCVWAAPVSVEYHTSHLAATGSDRFAKRVSDERYLEVWCHGDPENSAGRQIGDEG